MKNANAKGILKRVKQVYASIKMKARHLVGNYRYQKYWSDEAQVFMAERQLFSFTNNGNDGSLASKFVRDVREYYSYYGEYDLQAINLALSLLRDVYSPDVLPLEICRAVLENERTARLMGEELFELLCHYGSLDIVYHDKARKIPKGIEKSCYLSRHLFLTRRRCGMPVRMFLIWAKGGAAIPAGVMQEWSGIPRSKMMEVYNEIINELRYSIIEKHAWEWQIEKTPRLETVTACF